jgi:hypothetical protein
MGTNSATSPAPAGGRVAQFQYHRTPTSASAEPTPAKSQVLTPFFDDVPTVRPVLVVVAGLTDAVAFVAAAVALTSVVGLGVLVAVVPSGVGCACGDRRERPPRATAATIPTTSASAMPAAPRVR